MSFLDFLKKIGIFKSGSASYKGDAKNAPLDYMDGNKNEEQDDDEEDE